MQLQTQVHRIEKYNIDKGTEKLVKDELCM